MKYPYQRKKFNPVHLQIIGQANAIMEDYSAQGYQLTLRQLYYQFVSREIFPESWRDKNTGSKNNERSYKKLGGIISDARLAGLVDWNHIADRTRLPHKDTVFDSLGDGMKTLLNAWRYNLWADQPTYVEVWVEKEALAEVVQQACAHLYVPWCSCRGYMSQSAMWRGSQRFLGRWQEGRECHLVYLGDHDPSGLDMSRDIEDRQAVFQSDVIVHRIALNYDQVYQYNPPPNPTKVTDSRAAAYIEEFGHECWELDALEPRILDRLIQDTIDGLVDPDLMDAAQTRERELEEELRDLIEKYSG